MTDSEINEAVVRKLGLGDPHEMFVIPPYCNSIEAAWEIVEKIEWFCLQKEHDGSGWTVWDMAGTEEANLIVTADTAPMAICLAFLKLP